MKPIHVSLAIGAVLFTSCMNYQYYTVNKKENAGSNSKGILSDSLTVQYIFNTQNEGMEILIKNESNIPVYVNWQRSALIIENETKPYWTNNAKVSLSEDENNLQWSAYTNAYGSTIKGEITGTEQIGFIPPRSVLKRFHPLPMVNDIHFEKQQSDTIITTPITRSWNQIVQYKYTEENSPLHFRSYITLSPNPNFNSEVVDEGTFWISGIAKTNLPPNQYNGNINNTNVLQTREFKGTFALFGAFCALGLAMTAGIFFATN
jgi:hypothetical protein